MKTKRGGGAVKRKFEAWWAHEVSGKKPPPFKVQGEASADAEAAASYLDLIKIVNEDCSCSVTLCDPMDCSLPGYSVLHHLLEFA